MTSHASAEADGAGRHFTTTRWSLILSSLKGDSDKDKAGEALAQLCRIYWRPIFAFVCRKGHSIPDAQDLTQDFFLMVLKGDLLRQADRSRGRFRSLLLTATRGTALIHQHNAGWIPWAGDLPHRQGGAMISDRPSGLSFFLSPRLPEV